MPSCTQRGAAGLRRLLERAGLHGRLVRGQLRVLDDVGVDRRGLSGLEVDDDEPALVVDLQPVDPALDSTGASGSCRRTMKSCSMAMSRARVLRDPADQPVQHRLGPVPLAAGQPAGGQLDGVEAFGHIGHQRRPVDGRVGGEHRRGVHQVADALLGGRRRARPRAAPAASAGCTGAHCPQSTE
jgi:hypothetical protein